MVKQVACPRCGTTAPFGPENKWRPFCSERCRLIDLGKWASGAYVISSPVQDGDSVEDFSRESDENS